MAGVRGTLQPAFRKANASGRPARHASTRFFWPKRRAKKHGIPGDIRQQILILYVFFIEGMMSPKNITMYMYYINGSMKFYVGSLKMGDPKVTMLVSILSHGHP